MHLDAEAEQVEDLTYDDLDEMVDVLIAENDMLKAMLVALGVRPELLEVGFTVEGPGNKALLRQA